MEFAIGSLYRTLNRCSLTLRYSFNTSAFSFRSSKRDALIFSESSRHAFLFEDAVLRFIDGAKLCLFCRTRGPLLFFQALFSGRTLHFAGGSPPGVAYLAPRLGQSGSLPTKGPAMASSFTNLHAGKIFFCPGGFPGKYSSRAILTGQRFALQRLDGRKAPKWSLFSPFFFSCLLLFRGVVPLLLPCGRTLPFSVLLLIFSGPHALPMM